MAWSRLCVALAAVVSVASTAAAPMLGQADSIAWEPLANHHADRFFHTPAGSTQKHVHRRLQECTSFRADMDTGKKSLSNFADTVTTFDPKTKLNAKESISNALDWGNRFGNIKFESIVRGLEGFVAVGAGVLTVIEFNGIFTDLHEFKEQVNQVFTVVSKIQRRVEELPNVIEYELNRAEYNRLFDEINNVNDPL